MNEATVRCKIKIGLRIASMKLTSPDQKLPVYVLVYPDEINSPQKQEMH